MFTWLPNDTSPASTWMTSHGELLALSILAVAGFAVMIRFSRPRAGYGDVSGSSDECHADADSGSCDCDGSFGD